ncbi:major facilitator superfamily domain-containing protein [Penicillium hispanicum]|uniref:major facilitator superfamily domain-containing protein n=1 Tax=Penicillium hispanicum TaxID=1080232 RepID=UPI002541758F|nr:major facilitator superfamily domain-containing protein [Penicillium hispanicum]KAJ5580011.1 major facilitator superfamily domain-containing protein [Penicillium hispanicum]
MANDKVDVGMKMVPDSERASIGDGQLEKVVEDLDNARHDKALALLAEHHVSFDPSSPEAKRVLQKIDYRIMPLIIGIYTLMLVDKNSLSFANIMNIKEDTNLTDSQYSWLGSIVYFGYLAGEIPVTFLMQRVPIGKFFAVMSMIWGIIEMLHAACHNFGGLLAVRFLLGMIEVSTAPVVIYILGSWYTKEEQVSRVAIWYVSSGLGTVVGGFFAWIIYHAQSFRWQALFLYEGGLTLGIGILLWFVLAASPTEATWLSEEEKVLALERVRENKTGTEVWRFNKSQLIEAFCDVRFYLVFMILVSIGLPNGGITVFGPAIISAFGFNDEQTTLLSMVPGAAAILGTFVALGVAKYTNRTGGAIFTLLLSCIGVIMMLTIDPAHYVSRYGGYILTMQFPICVLFLVAFMTAGVGGTTKKLAFSASYQLGYTVGNIIGPQTYRASDAPDYPIAKYTMLAFLIFSLFLFALFGLIHRLWNIKRDKQDAVDEQNGVPRRHVENEEFADLTDFNQKSLRYPE